MKRTVSAIALARAAFIEECLTNFPEQFDKPTNDQSISWLIATRLEHDPDYAFLLERRAVANTIRGYPEREFVDALMAINNIITETRTGFLKRRVG